MLERIREGFLDRRNCMCRVKCDRVGFVESSEDWMGGL